MTIALAIFDLTGTTVRDSAHISGAFEHVLRRYGIPCDAELIAAVRGLSKREAVEACPEVVDRVTDVHDRPHVHRRGALSRTDVRIALNTGLDRRISAALLDEPAETAQSVSEGRGVEHT